MIQNTEKVLFTRELSVLLKSGVSLRDSLISLREQSQFSGMKPITSSLITDIENGQTLAHAMERFPKIFDHLYRSLVFIGERTGTLPKNFEFMSLQIEKGYQLKRKIQGILLYPTIVLVTALTLASLISIFILPKMIRLFESFHVDLPWTTRLLLWFARLMQAHGIIIFFGIITILIVVRGITLSSFFRPYWHRFLLNIPIIGRFLRQLFLAQFFRDMGVMLGSGLPLSQALLVEERAARNVVFSQMARGLQQASLEGRSLAEELTHQYGALVPGVVVRMVSTGEHSGKLSETFFYLGDFLDEEVDREAKNFAVVLEPVLLILIALLVVFLAVSILAPIYSLTGSVHH